MVARTAIVRGGLADDPTVTPASLTLWAARRVFETTGHIEAAANLIGMSSLDATAAVIAWDWRETE